MKRGQIRARAGLTLLEVIVSLMILLIGVTGVLVLFPIGMASVRQAVLDTRCTLVAQSMRSVADAKGMLNDPLHLCPYVPPDTSGALTAPYSGFTNYLQSPFRSDQVLDQVRTSGNIIPLQSYYANVVPYSGTTPDLSPPTPPLNPATVLAVGSTDGVPILIDPEWVHSLAPGVIANNQGWEAGPPYYGRQTAMNFQPLSSVLNYMPLAVRVVSTAEAVSIATASVRDAYIQRWFHSTDEVLFQGNRVPGLVVSPVKNGALINDSGAATFPQSPASTTASRNSLYSWAVLVQRPVTVTTGPVVTAQTPGQTQKAVLVFWRRNIANPYSIAAAAFVNGDSRVTVRYPLTQPKPIIRVGTWLAEITVRGTGAADRRAFNFFRVSNFADLSPGVISVTLEKEASGTPNTLVRGTGYYNATYPPTNPNYAFPDDNPVAPAGGSVVPTYVPIVIFDGLQEVYSWSGLWGS